MFARAVEGTTSQLVVLKVVHYGVGEQSKQSVAVSIAMSGLASGAVVSSAVEVRVLQSGSELDENSFEQPMHVAVDTSAMMMGAASFVYNAPPNSLSVLRLVVSTKGGARRVKRLGGQREAQLRDCVDVVSGGVSALAMLFPRDTNVVFRAFHPRRSQAVYRMKARLTGTGRSFSLFSPCVLPSCSSSAGRACGLWQVTGTSHTNLSCVIDTSEWHVEHSRGAK